MKYPAILRAAIAAARSAGVRTLAADPLEQPKTVKSRGLGILTLPVHLAPADSAGGATVCAYAGACSELCLDAAGNPAYATGKARARINRTRFYWSDRDAFMLCMWMEAVRHIAHARRLGLRPAVRPNATSDNAYERVSLTVTSEMSDWSLLAHNVAIEPGRYRNIMECVPAVSWYDYTKIPARYRVGRLADNYHLTYSYDPRNKPADMLEALDSGLNVAVPFMGKTLPDRVKLCGRFLDVINGDAHDYRPADPAGVVVGLTFKRITAPAVVARIGSARARTGDGFAIDPAAVAV
jgi:hypothetical protein